MASLNKKRGQNKSRKQAKKSAKGRAHSDAPKNYWKRKGPKLEFGREQFRIWGLRGRLKRKLDLDQVVDSCTWLDESVLLTGEISIRQPRGVKPLPLGIGNRIRVEYRPTPSSAWRELWTMRCTGRARSLKEGTYGFTLANDLANVQRSEDDWRFIKDRRHRRGWRGDQVIRAVAHRCGIKVGTLPRMRHYHKKLVATNVSGLDIIIKVLLAERTNHSRRFAMYFERERLHIRPLRRSNQLLVLGPMIVEAALNDTLKDEFATAITLRGKGFEDQGVDSKGHKKVAKRKLWVKLRSRGGVARYGLVHRIVYDQDADSVGELRAVGRRYLAKVARPNRELTISHPGIPRLRRLDAIRQRLPELGITQIIFVKSLNGSLTPGGFDMDITLTFDDPFVDKKAERVTEDLVEKAKKNGRVTKKKAKKKKAKAPARNKDRGTGRPPRLGGVETPVR